MPFIFKGGTCLILLLKHQQYFHLNNVRNRCALAETAWKRGILNLPASLRTLEKISIFFWIFYLLKILMPEWWTVKLHGMEVEGVDACMLKEYLKKNKSSIFYLYKFSDLW